MLNAKTKWLSAWDKQVYIKKEIIERQNDRIKKYQIKQIIILLNRTSFTNYIKERFYCSVVSENKLRNINLSNIQST